MLVDKKYKKINPYLVAFSVILPTFFAVLGTSATNVAMKHIAGFLGATQYETNTVITTYLIANAMVLPLSGWLTKTFGQKNTLYLAITMFTLGAFLCIVSHSLHMLLLARVVQGIGGGALLPMCQAILLSTFPPQQRGMAMGIFGFSIILPPLLGPTFGGWITDNASWQWIFLINIPVGIISMILVYLFIFDPPEILQKRIKSVDIVGLMTIIMGLGSMQYVLDKGQQYNWFDTGWICILSAISVFCFVFFICWELDRKNPIADISVFRDINFTVGSILGAFIQVVLYSTLMLLPAFLQTLLGYSPTASGLSILPRSLSVAIMLIIVGRIADKVDNRILTVIGLTIIGYGTFLFTNINLSSSIQNVMIPNLVLGSGIAFTFISVSSISFATLPGNKIHDGAGLGALTRSVAGAFATSLAATCVERHSQMHQFMLIQNLTPNSLVFQQKLSEFNSAFLVHLPQILALKRANAQIYHDLLMQSRLFAYFDTFSILALISFLSIPMCLLFRINKKGRGYLKKQYLWFFRSLRHYQRMNKIRRIKS